MTTLKTLTSAMTAAVLVTGIGLAVAQTDSQPQPAEPLMALAVTSEDSPADPNAVPQDNSTLTQQQSTDPAARTSPPVDGSTVPLPSRDADTNANANGTATGTTSSTTSGTTGDMTSRSAMDSTPLNTAPRYDSGRTEPAPRADRN